MAKDFKNKQFARIIRGYNPEEVDEYIGYINDEYRKLERRCADSERKLALALKKLDEMHQKFLGADNAENELAAAAISEAKDEADRIIADANSHAAEITGAAEQEAAEKARVILEEAAKEAEEILSGAENDASVNKKTAESLFATAEKMYGEVCAFRDSLFEIYNTHIESIEHMTEEAERAMGVIEDEYDAVAPEPEDTVEDTPESEEAEEEIAFDDESSETMPEEMPEQESDGESAEDLYIDLEDSFAEDDELDALFTYEESEETAEEAPAEEYEEYGEFEDPDEYEDDLESDYDEPSESDYDTVDSADYDEIDGEIRINWNSRQNDEEDDGFNEDNSGDTAEETEKEPADEEVFRDLDDMFSEGEETELSLTEEFDLVFNASNARKNVEQIRKQPTVAPEKPRNPKKHQKF